MDLLDRLVDHDHWATSQLLEACRGLSDAQLDRPFDVGLGSLRDTFDHLIFNIDYWTAAMAGQPLAAERDARSIAVLRERHERAHAAYAALARRVRDEQRLNDTFTHHGDESLTFGTGILHLPIHNAEHRAEALHMLQRLGVSDLPEVDPALWEYLTQTQAQGV